MNKFIIVPPDGSLIEIKKIKGLEVSPKLIEGQGEISHVVVEGHVTSDQVITLSRARLEKSTLSVSWDGLTHIDAFILYFNPNYNGIDYEVHLTLLQKF